MKPKIFILALILLMLVGTYSLLYDKMGLPSMRVPFLGSANPVLPVGQWQQALVGKWKYRRVFRATDYTWVYEGEVEYGMDGRFNRFITCKHYWIPNDLKPKDELISSIAGGSYWGKWSVDATNQFFKEDIEGCDVITGRADSYGKKVDFCNTSFAKGNTWLFGHSNSSKSRFEMKRFCKNKIVVQGELFAEAAKVEAVFERID